jgi:hypothetical protein
MVLQEEIVKEGAPYRTEPHLSTVARHRADSGLLKS